VAEKWWWKNWGGVESKARAGRFVGDAAAMGSGAVDSALSALRDEDPLATAALAELRGSLGLEVFRSVDVIHCRNAYGCALSPQP
jgi:hypothetical protein